MTDKAKDNDIHEFMVKYITEHHVGPARSINLFVRMLAGVVASVHMTDHVMKRKETDLTDEVVLNLRLQIDTMVEMAKKLNLGKD